MNSEYQSRLNPNIMKILWRQQQNLLDKAPEGVYPIINDKDITSMEATIEGPKSTPYENGLFKVRINFPCDFPISAPKGIFLTKIYHPNVSEKGDICVNTLDKDWNPGNWSLYNVLEVIKCLMIIPFPESSLNEEAGKLFMENYDEYNKIAKIYTEVHAKSRKKTEDNASYLFITPSKEKTVFGLKDYCFKSNDDKNTVLNKKRGMMIENIQDLRNDLSSTPSKSNEENIKKWLGRI